MYEDDRGQADPINQLHADMESLIEESGLERTILRSNTASNARGLAGQIRSVGVVRGPDVALHSGDRQGRYRGRGGTCADR